MHSRLKAIWVFTPRVSPLPPVFSVLSNFTRGYTLALLQLRKPKMWFIFLHSANLQLEQIKMIKVPPFDPLGTSCIKKLCQSSKFVADLNRADRDRDNKFIWPTWNQDRLAENLPTFQIFVLPRELIRIRHIFAEGSAKKKAVCQGGRIRPVNDIAWSRSFRTSWLQCTTCWSLWQCVSSWILGFGNEI